MYLDILGSVLSSLLASVFGTEAGVLIKESRDEEIHYDFGTTSFLSKQDTEPVTKVQ